MGRRPSIQAEFGDESVTVYLGDVREVLAALPAESVQCCVTSPPYWGLRDYGVAGQLGLEATPREYVAAMVDVFREVRRVLRKDGTCWINMGDSYASAGGTGDTTSGFNERWPAGAWSRQGKQGDTHSQRPMRGRGDLKPKDLVGMPWRLAFALQEEGWWLRSDIIWSKPNPMPESVTDRPTKAHEYLFLLAKSATYYYDADAVRTPLQPKTFTTFGTVRHDPGDGSGLVKSENFGRDVPVRVPRYKNADLDKQNGHKRLVESVKAARAAGGPHDQPFDLAGANRRSVWEIATQPYPDAHFATFPEELARIPILAGTRPRDVVLDPFAGSGTTLAVAKSLDRQAIGIELNQAYLKLIRRRCESVAAQVGLPLGEEVPA